MKKLLATCDRIIARLPLAATEANIVGGIIIPAQVLKAIDRRGMAELEIVSAGPDCKVAQTGDHVVVNKAVCEPLEWDGAEYMIFSEVTAFAIIKDKDIEKPQIQVSPPPLSDLTIEEIRTGLGVQTEPVDDSAAVPEQPSPGASVA